MVGRTWWAIIEMATYTGKRRTWTEMVGWTGFGKHPEERHLRSHRYIFKRDIDQTA
jgi:hypothetical protein